LAKESLDYIQKFPLASLKVIGSVENLLMRRLGIGTMTTLIKDVRRHLVANRNWWNYDFANTICYAYKTHLRHLPLPAVYNLF
jgi:hypothetical protein